MGTAYKEKAAWTDGGWWRVRFRRAGGRGGLAEDETPERRSKWSEGWASAEWRWVMGYYSSHRQNRQWREPTWALALWPLSGGGGFGEVGGLPSVPWSAPPTLGSWICVWSCPVTAKPGDCGESAGIVKVRGAQRRHTAWNLMPPASWDFFIRSGEGKASFPRTAWSEPNYPWSHEFEQWGFCHLALGNGSAARTDCATLTKWAALPTCTSGHSFGTGTLSQWNTLRLSTFYKKELWTQSPRQKKGTHPPQGHCPSPHPQQL